MRRSKNQARTRRLAMALLAVGLMGCRGTASTSSTATTATTATTPSTLQAPPAAAFTRSAGGAVEVEPEWLAAHQREVRVIDVREREELAGGRIDGGEWIPIGSLDEAAADWDRDQPIVLVCRSGRRSARAAAQLEALGFRSVASLTGGMLRWTDHGLPVTRDAPAEPANPTHATQTVRVDGQELEIRWTRVVALLTGGSEACIDGRHAHAVIGTPGGDAGEFLLMLAAFEELTGHEVTGEETDRLLDDYIAAFGRFYLHTDTGALERLGASLRRDPRFADAPLQRIADIEAIVRHPSPVLASAVSDAFAEPQHVGCGHLRAVLEHPAEYRVRAELTTEVLRAIHRKLVRQPESVDFEVLEGHHEERQILIVRLDHDVQPYSTVPAIAPGSAGAPSFVVHPQVSAFVRDQNAHFLFEETPWLRDRGVDIEAFGRHLEALGTVQLEATVAHLAPTLPRRELVFHGREPSIP